MVDEPELDEDDTAPHTHRFDVDRSHGSIFGPNGVVINNNYHSASLHEFLDNRTGELLDKLLASQEDHIGLLRDNNRELEQLKVHHEREIERLHEQLAKVRGVVRALLRLFVTLGEDKEHTAERLAEVELALAGEEHFRADFDQLQRHLDDLTAQQDRVMIVWRDARIEAGVVLQLWAALRMRWFTLAGPEPAADDARTVIFALPESEDDDKDLLAHAQRTLDEAHKVLVEVHRVLEEIAAELYQTSIGEKSSAAPDASKVERELAKVRRLLKDYEKDAVEQKKRHEREIARRERETATPTKSAREGTNGLFPGAGLFLLGVFFRQLRQMPALTGGQELVVGAVLLILAALPSYSLWKWSKGVDSRASTTVVTVGAYCVIVGNLGWIVALVPGLAALYSVVAAKKISSAFVLVVLAAAALGVLFPSVMWWSWTGFDWLARVF